MRRGTNLPNVVRRTESRLHHLLAQRVKFGLRHGRETLLAYFWIGIEGTRKDAFDRDALDGFDLLPLRLGRTELRQSSLRRLGVNVSTARQKTLSASRSRGDRRDAMMFEKPSGAS